MIITQEDEREVTIQKGETTVKVQKYGATITSWKHKGQELLYISPLAKLDGSKAIRGGIPIVFPRFGPSSLFPNQQHGFARNSIWKLLPTGSSNCEYVKFRLEWDAGVFEPSGRLELTVKIGGAGELGLELVPQFDSKEFEYHMLFHTYFLTNPDLIIEGLQNVEFGEKQEAYKLQAPTSQILKEVQGLDRMYFQAKNEVTLKTKSANSPESMICIGMKSEEKVDVVVWNPGKEMADVPAEDVNKFVCIEHGYVYQLQTTYQTLSVTYIPKIEFVMI